jgi:4-aminobutyrate aminotransferase-like enzyme
MVRGAGVFLWDRSGKRYLDFVSGYSSTSFGHAHPRLVEVAASQLGQLTQLVGWNHSWRGRLEEKLAGLASAVIGGEVKVWLTTSGARAVELAWKIAYAHRPGSLACFEGAYHGRSLATALISDTRKLPIVQAEVAASLPFPRCLQCPYGLEPQSCAAECFSAVRERLQAMPSLPSAILVEPALGARGYYYAPPPFFQQLQQFARLHHILLIDDEIQMGLGRLGSMFAAERQGWSPDLVLLGKSLGGGLVPVAAVLGRAEVMDRLPAGIDSETFAANPLACRLALEALAILEESLLVRGPSLEGWLRRELEKLAHTPSLPMKTSSLGASAVIELDPRLAGQVAERCVDHGLLVHWSGRAKDRIVLIPPLVVEEAEVIEAFSILREVLRQLAAEEKTG